MDIGDVLDLFYSEICNASPCSLPIEIKKLVKKAMNDKDLFNSLKKLANNFGINLNFSNEIEAYLSISKLARVICESTI